MNQEDVQQVIDAKVGSIISVDNQLIPVVGHFSERYSPNGVAPHDEYCLSLDGKQEIGFFPDGEGFGVWYARYSRKLPWDKLDRVRRSLTNAEVGRVKRLSGDGVVSPAYPDYVFGDRLGRHIFLALNAEDGFFEVWINYNPTNVKVTDFVKRPYGWKRVLSDKSQELIIEPRKHTGLNATPLNEQGLRGNPVAWERVMHLGYLDGSNGDASLLYRFLGDGNVQERSYRKGNAFFSVSPTGSGENKSGYWNLLINNSDRPIRLFTRWEDE